MLQVNFSRTVCERTLFALRGSSNLRTMQSRCRQMEAPALSFAEASRHVRAHRASSTVALRLLRSRLSPVGHAHLGSEPPIPSRPLTSMTPSHPSVSSSCGNARASPCTEASGHPNIARALCVSRCGFFTVLRGNPRQAQPRLPCGLQVKFFAVGQRARGQPRQQVVIRRDRKSSR